MDTLPEESKTWMKQQEMKYSARQRRMVLDEIQQLHFKMNCTFADGAHGMELWKNDGTEAGTFFQGLIRDK